jgi:hypothetical protein
MWKDVVLACFEGITALVSWWDGAGQSSFVQDMKQRPPKSQVGQSLACITATEDTFSSETN